MMKLRVDYKSFAKEVESRHRTALIRGLNKGGEVLAQTMRQGMGTSGTPGRPGRWPGIRTGTLKSSIHVVKASPRSLTVSAGSRLRRKYPSFLQTGTARMRARPWITIAWNKVKRQVPKIVMDEYKRAKKK